MRPLATIVNSGDGQAAMRQVVRYWILILSASVLFFFSLFAFLFSFNVLKGFCFFAFLRFFPLVIFFAPIVVVKKTLALSLYVSETP